MTQGHLYIIFIPSHIFSSEVQNLSIEREMTLSSALNIRMAVSLRTIWLLSEMWVLNDTDAEERGTRNETGGASGIGSRPI